MNTKQQTRSLAFNEAARIEVLFNSVEVELDRRWSFGEVPATFKNRPADHIRRMVKAWWQIYHESAAATSGRNRTVWERNPAYQTLALDTASLVDSLNQINQLINLEAIRAYRPVKSVERSAVCILGLIKSFYVEIRNQTPT